MHTRRVKNNAKQHVVCQSCLRLQAEIQKLKEEQKERDRAHQEELRLDYLTGIFNRRGFDEMLAKEVANASRHRQPLCFAICDIDYFKRINDTYGHAVGDTILREVAGLLSSLCRVTDDVARLGGEEFGIILRFTDIEGAYTFIERLRSAIEAEIVLYQENNTVVQCTASFGVGQLRDGETIDMLMKRVDTALYEAKREGRNKVVSV